MTTQKLIQQLITQYASALADTSDNSFRRKNYLEMMNQAIYKLDIFFLCLRAMTFQTNLNL